MGIGITNFIPGWKTLEGIGKGIGKVFQGDFGGAIKAVGKGLSNDFGAGIVATIATGGLASGFLWAQAGAVGLDLVGALGPDEEGNARQQDSYQHLQEQFPNGSPGYW